ncbi:MAG TPA: hypothetical protein VE822_09240 [Candidatus Elarobacter sp.]|nr:hypothetical protein [Candidatus Elarobacter sp.]
MVTDPVEDLGKAEFVPLHRGDYECVSVQALDFDVKAVAPQEYIGGGESDAPTAVEEAEAGGSCQGMASAVPHCGLN